ncbi:hypothetical protein I4F81_005592 [Pyropia yezoensis]|uniref:Uncharacterized protein n=1 Tax=Pyropia yezoensis TaxID=2788 RepID=A0ACC3BYP6_PYRYE|nr:hypothetical protein I4F81_005592 [Neopyropia yezoensis]
MWWGEGRRGVRGDKRGVLAAAAVGAVWKGGWVFIDGAYAAEVTGVAREAAGAAANAAAPSLFRESAPSAADAPPLLAATDVCWPIGTADTDVVMPMIPPQRYSARSGGWAWRPVRKWGGRGSGAERLMTGTPFEAVSICGRMRQCNARGEGSMGRRILHGPQHGKTGVSDGGCEV